MRLILNLKSKDKIKKIEREYIRNYIYSCVKTSKWSFYHDKPRYKHFCYSNLFPFDKEGFLSTEFKLIISSPYPDFIQLIKDNTNNYIQLGDYKLEVSTMSVVNTPEKISNIQTATPIVVRFPDSLYEKYDIKSSKKYTYWTSGEVLNSFIELLHKNAFKRYKDFLLEKEMLGIKNLHDYPKTIEDDFKKDQICSEDFNLFQNMRYKKTVFAWDKHNIGTMWQFGIKKEYQTSPIIKYLYDSGLGERSASSGSGFVNIYK